MSVLNPMPVAFRPPEPAMPPALEDNPYWRASSGSITGGGDGSSGGGYGCGDGEESDGLFSSIRLSDYDVDDGEYKYGKGGDDDAYEHSDGTIESDEGVIDSIIEQQQQQGDAAETYPNLDFDVDSLMDSLLYDTSS